MLDIAVNFRTAVLDDGDLEQDPSAVAWRYLQGWFALDLVTTTTPTPHTGPDLVWSGLVWSGLI